MCIDPLNPTSHPSNIVNIVSGQVADNTVNVQDAASIGTASMKEFEKSWPEGFQNTISKKVKTISDSQKHVKVGKEKVYDCTVSTAASLASKQVQETSTCPGTPLSDVVDQATRFIGGCYTNKVGAETTKSDMRYKIWAAKFGNTATSAPKIQSLPPSTEAFTENLKRAHLQTFIWKAAVSLDPPSIDPVEYGYARHEPSKSLIPVTVPAGVQLAPDEILSLIKCNCEGDKRCVTQRCGCSRQRLPCTLFCGCNAGNECFNELTVVGATRVDAMD